MAIKTVVVVDINTEEFKAFYSVFQSFCKTLEKTPAIWAEIAAKTAAARKEVIVLASTAGLEAGNVGHIADATSRMEKASRSTSTIWQKLSHDTKSVAGSIAAMTGSLFSFGAFAGFFTGLIGFGGGLFGIDAMAAAVANRRRATMGLGISYGQQSAFGLNYGRLVDTDAVLGGVNAALYDITSQAYVGLRSAGLSAGALGSGNAAGVSRELLHRLPRLFAGTPKGLRGSKLHALGLDQLIGMEDVNRYLNASPEERQTLDRQYATDAKNLDLSKEAQRGWQDFTTQMKRAGSAIEVVFMEGLTPLEPRLEKLSVSFAHLVDAVLSSPQVSKWINVGAEALERFGGYIGTDQFRANLVSFADRSIAVAEALKKAVVLAERLIWGRTLPDIPDEDSGRIAPNADRLAVPYRHHPTGPRPHGEVTMNPGGGAAFRVDRTGMPQASLTNGAQSIFSGNETPTQIVAKLQTLRDQGLVSNEQCVALVAAAMGERPGQWNVHSWRRGAAASAGNLTAGTPLATFLNSDFSLSDRYAGGGSGTPGANRDHAVVFLDYVKGGDGNIVGMDVAEQYAGSGGIHVRRYDFGQGEGERNASNYYVVRDQNTAAAEARATAVPAGDIVAKFARSGAWSATEGAMDPSIAARAKQKAQHVSLLGGYQGLGKPGAIDLYDFAHGGLIVSASGLHYSNTV